MAESQEAFDKLLEISEKVPFFQKLSQEEIKSLVKDVKLLTYKNNKIIFHEGENYKGQVYYLLHGKVAVHKKHEKTGKSIELAVIDKPSLFGEMMRLTGKPRNATVKSVCDETLVLSFIVKNIKETTALSKFYKSVIDELSLKINKMNEKLS